MSAIYDLETGNTITEGLQGSDVCNTAIQAAQSIAKDRGEPVQLSDDDGDWIVHPDGSADHYEEDQPNIDD